MNKIIIAAAMVLPMLATGALAATYGQKNMSSMYRYSAPMKQSMENEACTFEPSTNTWANCDGDRSHELLDRTRDHAAARESRGGRNGGGRNSGRR